MLFGQRLTLKSLFTTTTTHHRTFLVSDERYGQINTFLLQYYGTDFALIKRYDQFCFLLMYIRRHRFSLLSLFSLLYLSSLCSLHSFISAHSFFFLFALSLSAHSLLSLCYFSISFSFSTLYLLIFLWTELDLEECQILFLSFLNLGTNWWINPLRYQLDSNLSPVGSYTSPWQSFPKLSKPIPWKISKEGS